VGVKHAPEQLEAHHGDRDREHQPSPVAASPGTENSQRGLKRSMNRRWRQPSASAQVGPPAAAVGSGWWAPRRCALLLGGAITISLANSIPGLRRRARGRLRGKKPRMPQWAS